MIRFFTPILTAVILSVCSAFVSPSWSAVIVYDRITTVGTPVHLVFKTKGRFFAQGGKLVDIYLEDKKLSRIMTGGDGYGYFKHTFQNPGYKQLAAASNGNRDSGLILVMKKNEKAILVEAESSFKNSLFSDEERNAARQALASIAETYKIIYCYTFAGKQFTKNWLSENDFPPSVMLPWQGAKILKVWKKMGIHIHVMVGSPAMLEETADLVKNRFSFEETQKGETVKNWKDVQKRLEGMHSDDMDPEKP
jgi:hypothetical protein